MIMWGHLLCDHVGGPTCDHVGDLPRDNVWVSISRRFGGTYRRFRGTYDEKVWGCLPRKCLGVPTQGLWVFTPEGLSLMYLPRENVGGAYPVMWGHIPRDHAGDLPPL